MPASPRDPGAKPPRTGRGGYDRIESPADLAASARIRDADRALAEGSTGG